MKIGRKIAAFGRSMENAIANSERLGYIKVSKETFVDAVELNQLPANEIMTLRTDSQGEPVAAFSRIINGTYRQISIQPGDTVILPSPPILGNTTSANRLINLLSEAGAEIIHRKVNNIHTPGYGGQEEQRLTFRLMKPKYPVPVHGEFRMLKVHASLAQDTGVSEENCFTMNNGGVLTLTADSARPAGHLNANDTYVDGNGIDDIGNVVLRDRCILSEEGLVLAVAIVDIRSKEVMVGPDILSRGFVYMREPGDMIHGGQRLLFNTLRGAMEGRSCTEAKLGEVMTTAL